jgi:hypothetical protein
MGGGFQKASVHGASLENVNERRRLGSKQDLGGLRTLLGGFGYPGSFLGACPGVELLQESGDIAGVDLFEF